ncbi:Unannotated [Lentimonas sp. CC4]|nr:Unannotated [Lentimonas sp. CC4]CAA7180917.1 Unannotated [Lentimonas sp. CC8]
MGLQAARTVYSVVVTPLARICSVRVQWLNLGSTLTQDSRQAASPQLTLGAVHRADSEPCGLWLSRLRLYAACESSG